MLGMASFEDAVSEEDVDSIHHFLFLSNHNYDRLNQVCSS